MTVIVDRFENGRAVCLTLDGRELRADPAVLPPDIHEGSVLRRAGGRWIPCPRAERKRRDSVRKKMAVLFGRKP